VTSEERQYLYQIRVNWSLDMKIRHFLKVVNNFIDEVYPVDVAVSFSGGADSLVMLDIIRKRINPDFPAVFADTGVEFPEIRKFVKTFDNCHVIKPVIPYKDVLLKYGYPVISKESSQKIYEIRNSTEHIKNTRLNGDKKGNGKLSEKWKFLIDAPFKISSKCCNILKKNPINRWQKKNNILPIIGTMARESQLRKMNYYQHGCNIFNKGQSRCRPLSIFTSSDVWEYIQGENLSYCEIYDCGYKQTGCMSCGFGCHLEKGENRYQKLYKSHHKIWNYHIDNLGWGKVLDFIGLPYSPIYEQQNFDFKNKEV
jgi:3'-phosphoadenosine 5'-phosphosulfate sulfotransferase (PAPS reductase)/FAD synthetase